MKTIRLKVCNWNVATTEALSLLEQLIEADAFRYARSPLYEILFKGMGANPHHSHFGVLPILSLAFQSNLTASARDELNPTTDEVRAVLAKVPQLREHFRLRTKGQSWHLNFQLPRLRVQTKDWRKFNWVALFDTGDRVVTFSFSGAEFLNFTGLFARLNGTETRAELLKSPPQVRDLIRRFLQFAELNELLDTGPRVRGARAKNKNQFELVSHSCLAAQAGGTTILVDPAFLVPPPHHSDSQTFRRMLEWTSELAFLKGVFITHHHWDHLHLPTVVRLPRETPLFIPRPTRVLKERYPFDSSIKDFLLSLGFKNIRELAWHESVAFEGMEVKALPFYGEWFGPRSSFDAYSYQVRTEAFSIYGSVDGDRDERGEMKNVMKEIKESLGQVDFYFFCSSSQTHGNPVYAGAPFSYSNTYGRRYKRWLRYHPDWKTVAAWCRTLKPRYAVPYAEFIFHNRKVRKPIDPPHSKKEVQARFDDYWKNCISADEPWLRQWRQDLKSLNRSLKPLGGQVLMMGPGEAVSPSRAMSPSEVSPGRGRSVRNAPDKTEEKGKRST